MGRLHKSRLGGQRYSARSLADMLGRAGLKVCYDEFSLKLDVFTINGLDTVVQKMLTKAYMHLHPFDEAIEDATEALRIAPQFTYALRIRARA